MTAIENRGPQVAATASMFLALSWITVALRCYVRGYLTKSFGLDDWLALAALVCGWNITSAITFAGLTSCRCASLCIALLFWKVCVMEPDGIWWIYRRPIFQLP